MTGEGRTGEFLKRSIQYPKRFCKLSRFGGPCGGMESRLKEASLEEEVLEEGVLEGLPFDA
jgi:hypothetical protein